jgi:F-type H+-transporting ATPase subunit b
VLAEAHAQAEAERVKLLQQASDAAAHTHNEAKVAIDNDRAVMERTLQQKACALAIVIANRLLSRLPARTATAALLESLTAAVAELPEDERRTLAVEGGQLELVSAVSLDEHQQRACLDMMGRMVGQMPAMRFRTDPSLIAGIELHTSGMFIRNSWQADLERIASELRQDEQHVAESEHLA